MAHQSPIKRDEIRVYQVEASKAFEIMQRGKPLTEEELEHVGPADTYSIETLDQVRQGTPEGKYTLPARIGELVFPTVLFATPFCFCIGYNFKYIQTSMGLKLVLECEYFCINSFLSVTI